VPGDDEVAVHDDPMESLHSFDPTIDLAAILDSHGVPADDIAAARAEGSRALALLAMEHILFPDRGRLTPAELFERVETDSEAVRALWRALGFAGLPEDQPALYVDDLVALQSAEQMLIDGTVDEETVFREARVIGRSMARITESYTSALMEQIEAARAVDPDLPGDGDLLVQAASQTAPLMEELVRYQFRRHLLDSFRRTLLGASDNESGTDHTVGFADIVGFTASVLVLSSVDLGRLVERFEAMATDVVSRYDGRVVKSIGDEVMFVMPDAPTAAFVALELIDLSRSELGADLRVALARGPTLATQGDFYGSTVNRAARLVGMAYPGTVLIDEAVASALDEHRGRDFFTKRTSDHDLEGLGKVKSWVLRRWRARGDR